MTRPHQRKEIHMNFTFLGTGSAFTNENFQSNAVIEVNGKKLLIDAGGDIRRSLKAAGVNLWDLDGIYVTHLHSDHWGGAEFLAYGSFFNPMFVVNGQRRRLKLYAHPSVREGLWNSMKDSTVLPNKSATLNDYFDVQEFDGDSFQWEGVQFDMVKTVHCLDDSDPMPCFGLTWRTDSGKQVWFSADAILDRDQPLFNTADVIFHDCETGFKTGVHAHYDELLTLPATVRAKITNYHYNDGNKADCKAAGFAGWAVQGEKIAL